MRVRKGVFECFQLRLLPPELRWGREKIIMMEAAFIQIALSITKHLVAQSTFNNQMEEKEVDGSDEDRREERRRAEVPAAGLTSGTSSCTCVFGGGGKHDKSEALIFRFAM